MGDLMIFAWLLACAFFGLFTVRRKALTWDGALAACILGLGVVFLSGPVWLIPLFAFFGSSLVLGKLFRKRTGIKSDAKQGLPRDAVQVLSNGLPYVLVVCWSAYTPEDVGAYLLITMAVATSDTWSSEVGTALRGSTVNVIGFKRIEPGRSGGISLGGSVAGLAGAFCIALLSLVLPMNSADTAKMVLAITASGFSGMMLDSVLGSLFQARYSSINNDLSDQGDRLVGGMRWMTNDAVNLLSNAMITASALWLSDPTVH